MRILSVLLATLVAAALGKPPYITPTEAPPPLKTFASSVTRSGTNHSDWSSTVDSARLPGTTTIFDSAQPAPQGGGPICECGFTYCAAVLKAMKKPWNDKQLVDAYCSTPHAPCTGNKPTSKIDSALFICLCENPEQKIGTHLDLLCGCDVCLNIGPDNRARCETPCLSGERHWH